MGRVLIVVQDDIYYMNLAFEQALKASDLEEVPIGCVIVLDGEVIATAYNRKELDNVSIYHAEMLAIEQACRKLGTWYLDKCILYTTVEPCMMCTGAIIQSRISRVVYGASNSAFGYLSKASGIKFEVVSGILEEQCSKIMTDFFRECRRREKSNF